MVGGAAKQHFEFFIGDLDDNAIDGVFTRLPNLLLNGIMVIEQFIQESLPFLQRDVRDKAHHACR